MNNKEIQERFNQLLEKEDFICTKSELDDFLISGLLFKSKNTYITRSKKEINLKILKEVKTSFDINLNFIFNLISSVECNKIYCITQE